MNIIQIANIFTDHCFVVYFLIHICNQQLQSKVNRLRILHTYKDTHYIICFHFTKVIFSPILCLHPYKIIYCFFYGLVFKIYFFVNIQYNLYIFKGTFSIFEKMKTSTHNMHVTVFSKFVTVHKIKVLTVLKSAKLGFV